MYTRDSFKINTKIKLIAILEETLKALGLPLITKPIRNQMGHFLVLNRKLMYSDSEGTRVSARHLCSQTFETQSPRNSYH